MQKKPAMRYLNCTEVIAALKPFITASAGGPTPRRSMAVPRSGSLRPERTLPTPPAAKAAASELSKPAGPPRLGGSLPPRATPSAVAGKQLPRPAAPLVRPPAPVPAPIPEPEPVPEAAAPVQDVVPLRRTLGQRLGNLGIILLSILFGFLAFIVSSMIKF